MDIHQNVKEIVPFLMISNMDSSLQFYMDGLGFKMTNKWTPRGKIEWCFLKLGELSVMLQEQRRDGSHHIVLDEGKPGVGVSLVITCTDALVIYEDLKAKNITVSEPFVGNNMWVISVKDPDGYKIDFESTTDVPEETTYNQWINKS